jgi:hypothetical protein
MVTIIAKNVKARMEHTGNAETIIARQTVRK